MCGYIVNVIDSTLTQALMVIIGMDDVVPELRNNAGTGPASSIDIHLDDQGPQVRQAIWWRLLE